MRRLLVLLGVWFWCVPAALGQEPDWTKEEKDLFERTNKARVQERLPPLRADAKLCKAARNHARNMAKQKKLDHDLDGANPGDRMTKAGYVWKTWGENISYGQSGPAEAILRWLQSPPHRATLLREGYEELGVGIARDGQNRKYFVQVFGVPKAKE